MVENAQVQEDTQSHINLHKNIGCVRKHIYNLGSCFQQGTYSFRNGTRHGSEVAQWRSERCRSQTPPLGFGAQSKAHESGKPSSFCRGSAVLDHRGCRGVRRIQLPKGTRVCGAGRRRVVGGTRWVSGSGPRRPPWTGCAGGHQEPGPVGFRQWARCSPRVRTCPRTLPDWRLA